MRIGKVCQRYFEYLKLMNPGMSYIERLWGCSNSEGRSFFRSEMRWDEYRLALFIHALLQMVLEAPVSRKKWFLRCCW